MILYYVRHGDPIYNPNQLTPLGQRQAEAVGRRLAVHGIDRIFSSPSNRARQTAQPLCEIVKKEPVILDWADEDLAALDLFIKDENWCFRHEQTRHLLRRNDVLALGRNWHTHPVFEQWGLSQGITRMQREVDNWLESLGYRHDLENNCYYPLRENEERIALFAHEGVATAFLSSLLDIPFPLFSTHFDMTHSAVTVIRFVPENGVVIPMVLSYSNDSHIYREGLPTKHQNRVYY